MRREQLLEGSPNDVRGHVYVVPKGSFANIHEFHAAVSQVSERCAVVRTRPVMNAVGFELREHPPECVVSELRLRPLSAS